MFNAIYLVLTAACVIMLPQRCILKRVMVVSPKTEKVLARVRELIKWLRLVAALLKGLFG